MHVRVLFGAIHAASACVAQLYMDGMLGYAYSVPLIVEVGVHAFQDLIRKQKIWQDGFGLLQGSSPKIQVSSS